MKRHRFWAILFAPLLAAFPDLPARSQEIQPEKIEDLYKHCIQVAEETRKRFPRLAKPIFDLAHVHKRFGMDDRAVEKFREGLRVEPNHPEILVEMGFLLSQRIADQEILRQALAAFRQALRIDPGFPDAHTRIGMILIHLGKDHLPQAIEELRQEIHNRSATVMTYNLLGKALFDLGMLQEALVSLREAVRLDPEERGPYYQLSQVHKMLGNRDEELKALERFQKLKSREDDQLRETTKKGGNREEQLNWTVAAYIDASETYRIQNLPEETIRLLRGALAFSAVKPPVHNLIAEILRQSGKTDEAMQECQRLLAIDPKNYQGLFMMAGFYVEKKQFISAAQLLEDAIRLDPKEGDAYRELARLILSKKVPAGSWSPLELTRLAVEKSPVNSNYDVYSWALLDAGNPQRAYEALEIASRLEPGNEATQKRLQELLKRYPEIREVGP